MKTIGIFVKNLTSGGAEKQSVLLAKTLSDECNVHYLIFNAHKIHDKYIALLTTDNRIVIHTFKGNVLSRIIQFYMCLKENKIDILFSYLTMANILAAIIGHCSGVKLVYTGLRNAFLPWGKLKADQLICNYLSTAAISNSHSGKEYFIAKGFKKEMITVIPNCYDSITPYAPKPKNEHVRIITVGRFVKQKDYKTAIQAISIVYKTHKEIDFVIVGYGELEQTVREWVKEYGIEKITTIKINPDNIQQLEQDSDIYLSTSLFEGTSNSIMEGMDANLPIVCTNVGDNSQLVINGKNGFLCDVGNYKQIADFVKQLVEDYNQRIAMGRQSKEILLSKYGVEIFRQRYFDLIQYHLG